MKISKKEIISSTEVAGYNFDHYHMTMSKQPISKEDAYKILKKRYFYHKNTVINIEPLFINGKFIWIFV